MKKRRKHNLKLGPATLVLVRRTHGAEAEIAPVGSLNKGHISRMIRCFRPPSREFLEAMGPVLLNLSARSRTIAIQHEANGHA